MTKNNIIKISSLLTSVLLLSGCVNMTQIDTITKEQSNLLPSKSMGNEPYWQVILDDDKAKIILPLAQKELVFSELIKQQTSKGWSITTAKNSSLKIDYKNTICTDTMTGMPYPWQVELNLDGEKMMGCGGDSSELLIGEWQIEDINNQGIIDSSHITITFDNNNAYGSTGCNRYNIAYELSGEGIKFNMGLSTKMACPEAIMNQENRFLDTLHKITHLSIDERGALIMSGENVKLKAYKKELK